MGQVKFGDVVKEVKINIDRTNNPYDYYVAGDHMDSEDLTIRRKGSFATDDVGPAFTRLFKPGQILYGSRRTYLKKVAVADFEGICSNTTFVLETKDEGILRQRLLPFIMLTEEFTKWSISKSKGSTNPYILFSDLANYEFDLPDIARQDELVELLWQAYATKESYKKMILATDEMVKSQFIEMSKGSNVTMKLGELFELIRNGANIKQGFHSGGYPITRIETIADGFVDRTKMGFAGITDGSFAGYYLKDNDILMSHINSMKHIGKSAIYKALPGEVVIHGMNLLCLRLKENKANPIYVLYLLQSDKIREEIRLISKQAVNQASFTVSDLKSIRCELPCLDVQKAFEGLVQCADKSKFAGFKSQFIEMFGNPMVEEQKYPLKKLGDCCVINPKRSKIALSDTSATDL